MASYNSKISEALKEAKKTYKAGDIIISMLTGKVITVSNNPAYSCWEEETGLFCITVDFIYVYYQGKWAKKITGLRKIWRI